MPKGALECGLPISAWKARNRHCQGYSSLSESRRGRWRGRCPSASPTAARSSSRGQRSGRSSPSWAGLAPFRAMQPALSPIARIAATSSSPSRCSAGSAASSTRLSSIGQRLGPTSWIRVGATHSTAGWARFHWQASWIGVSPARSAIGQQPLQLLQARLDPAGGTEGAVVALRQLHPRPQVAPEEAAVVDDAGDHLDLVAGGGVEAELAGPGLERVEDDHRPVDPVAEALEAGDQVEGEAVGGPGGDADPRRQAGLAQRRHPVPDDLAGVAGAVGVVEQQQVEGGGADPLQAAPRPPSAGSRRTRPGRAGAGR